MDRQLIQTQTREILGDLRREARRDLDEIFPTDLDFVARNLIEVPVEFLPKIESEDSSVRTAGLIDRSQGIVISQEFSPQAQRFTLAHEIGHWVLHKGIIHHRDRPMATSRWVRRARSQEEQEADYFAAELLMPFAAVRNRFLAKFGINEMRLDQLSPSFLMRLSRYAGQSYDESMFRSTRDLSIVLATCRAASSRESDALCTNFDVSPVAMAIQLEDTGFVR